MGSRGDETRAEHSTLLVPAGRRPVKSRYLDMTLVAENPSETRPTFTKKLGTRIQQRKQLLLRRRYLVDLMLSVALAGIALMLVENELYYLDVSEKNTSVSLILKLFTTISTCVLLITILLYYHIGAEIKMLDAKVDDPLAMMSMTTWLCLIVEVLVCAVHPFPGDVQIYMTSIDGQGNRANVDGILSVIMMFRLYLVGRFFVAHSSLLTDPATQTISAVSHVKIDMFFVFKAAMADHPGKVIAFTMLSMYSVSVWAMRTCELYYTDISEAHSLTQSMWLSAITFLTVGYGDITPKTHCGRFISVITGLMGLGSTALLVAVVAKKMEQTRSDRYVFNYLSLIHLENKRKKAAADVIKFAIKVFLLTQRHQQQPAKVLKLSITYYSWKLSNAIRSMRSTRVARHRVEEASIGLPELSQQISQLQAVITMLSNSQGQILEKLSGAQDKVQQKKQEEEEAEDGDELRNG